MAKSPTKVAVILSGCGVNDGSEIHEAVSVLIHLSRHGAQVRCFAPNKEQAVAVNHYTGEVEPRRQRNMLHESARIARGGPDGSPGVQSLSELDPADFDAVVFPGGFGAAKNLCTFAVDGPSCAVEDDVRRVVRTFHAAGKPIGMCCIAPVIAAKVLGTKEGGPGCTVTIGAESDASAALARMGATHKACRAGQTCVDAENHLVTTPAYMVDAPLHEIHAGIGMMVDDLMAMIGKPSAVAMQR